MKNDKFKIYQYACPKCGSREFSTDTVSTTGGLFSKVFNLQTKKFTAITCKRCTYTELYRANSNQFENIIDFISG